MIESHVETKKVRLKRLLQEAGSLLVAFSGGVDSTFLLAVAQEVLGENAVAATAVSEIYPASEKTAAEAFATERGIQQVLFPSDELDLSPFVSNGPDRCYHCKASLFAEMVKIAQDKGLARVAHGANVDDLKDYRPGFRAAKEMGILAPLVEVGLSKNEIRSLSKEMGLRQWNKPSMACLASRIPYGTAITPDKLRMVAAAEAFLFARGVKQCRVRHHDSVARIEVTASDLEVLMNAPLRRAIVKRFKEIGYLHVALDLEGYTSGSMNRILERDEKGENPDAVSGKV